MKLRANDRHRHFFCMTTVATVTGGLELQIVGATSICQTQRWVHTESSLARVDKTALHSGITQHIYRMLSIAVCLK
jgi:hypothetical protein